MRGYAIIGLHHPKHNVNVGSVLRAARCFDVNSVFYTGKRYQPAPTDTMKAVRHLPLTGVEDLHAVIPYDCVPVAIELVPGARSLFDYTHPQRAFYVFGPEDGTLGASVLGWCRDKVYIPTNGCLNLAACVNVLLYDRARKQQPHSPFA